MSNNQVKLFYLRIKMLGIFGVQQLHTEVDSKC